MPQLQADAPGADPRELELKLLQENRPRLNADKSAALDAIEAALYGQLAQGTAIFIDGPGGTGKTYVYSMLLARVQSAGHIALPVASSGIAALLLAGGKTAHSQLKLPVKDVDEHSTCSFRPVETDLGEDTIKLSADMCAESDDPAALLDKVFGTDVGMFNQPAFMVGRGVLTPKNADVDDFNAKALWRFPGQETVLLSADSVEEESGAAIPVEYLNTLLPPGLPPHRLTLKLSAPIMLLQNISAQRGLANGTRLIVKGFHSRVIDAEIATGNREDIGQRVFIPRRTLVPSDSRLPFELSRRQFPIRPAFAMTFNKS